MTKLSVTYAATAAGCGLLLLVLSLWPGALSEVGGFLFVSAIIWLPFLVIAGVLWVVALVPLLLRTPREARRLFLVLCSGVAVFALCVGLIVLDAPLRAAFRMWRPAFEPFVATAPPAHTSQYAGVVLGRRVGIWWVDRYGRDPRGGVYFRIGQAGLLWEGSCGFAWQPNSGCTTPFGHRVRVTRITGDWFLFTASDD